MVESIAGHIMARLLLLAGAEEALHPLMVPVLLTVLEAQPPWPSPVAGRSAYRAAVATSPSAARPSACRAHCWQCPAMSRRTHSPRSQAPCRLRTWAARWG